nr:MAG TPA: tail completion protein [Caudoviricetes sp.]
MSYPAIKYSKSKIDTRKANNSTYSKLTRYEITVISKTPDHPVIDKLLELPYCSYDRPYKADGLNHDVLTLYY